MTVLEVSSILKDLIGFRSVSRQSNTDIIAYLEEFLRPLGFDLIRLPSADGEDRFNLLCKIGPDKEGGLMLSGHTDVVPVAGQNWDFDPFVLTQTEGRLLGRGTADMKGFIAASLVSLHQFPLKKLTKPLSLLWTFDEEVGCIGSQEAALVLKEHLHHLPQAALIGEPTDFRIIRMHSGHVTVRLKAKGKGAHSSDPDLGVSAVKAINGVLNSLFLLEKSLKAERSLENYFKRPYVTLNVGEVHGGTAVNIVPDEAYINLGFRPLPDTSIDLIFDRIKTIAAEESTRSNALITASLERCTPPMNTKEGSDLEKILFPFAKNDRAGAVQFATDGGNLSKLGIECLIFGPGSIDVAHRANEWILEDDLIKGVDTITGVLHRWFS
jgi:acetylornithine deacetylase